MIETYQGIHECHALERPINKSDRALICPSNASLLKRSMLQLKNCVDFKNLFSIDTPNFSREAFEYQNDAPSLGLIPHTTKLHSTYPTPRNYTAHTPHHKTTQHISHTTKLHSTYHTPQNYTTHTPRHDTT